ncbi:MAG: hypothetical protein PHE25_06560, partial [Candidatus Gracilibacteria bacterium]|nr:hypothetical protein [Candidatus Gracilibacteria bacterium]
GYHNDGTCYNGSNSVNCGNNGFGPQFIQGNGTTGKAMSFDGINSWIKTNNPYSNLDNTSRTYIVLGKIINYNPLRSDTFIGGGDYRLGLYDSGSGVLEYRDYRIGNIVRDNNYLIQNKYYLIVGEYDKYKNLSSIYINGLSTSIQTGGANIGRPTQPVLFGKNYGGMGAYDFLNGSIDEVRIYNRALSDSEIQNLYNSTK